MNGSAIAPKQAVVGQRDGHERSPDGWIPPILASRALALAWLVLAALVVGAPVRADAAEGFEAIEELRDSLVRRDRAAFVALHPPEARPRAQVLADQLFASPGQAVTVDVLGARTSPGGVEASLLWTLGSGGKGLSEGLRMDERPGGLVVERMLPAPVVEAEARLRVEPEERRLRVHARLTFEAPRGTDRLLLTMPAGKDWRLVEPADGTLTLQAERDGVPRQAVVPLAAPLATGERAEIVIEGDVTLEGRAQRWHFHGEDAYMPYAWEGMSRVRLTIETPAPWRAAAAGHRGTPELTDGWWTETYDTEFPVMLGALAIAEYSITKEGELELWRSRDVGGPPSEVLAQFRSLLDEHVAQLGDLPWRQLRLVESEMAGALASSRAGAIYSEASLLAKVNRRAEILTHEIGHQWFGLLVGLDDANNWISEGVADALMDMVLRDREGEEALERRIQEHHAKALQQLGKGSHPLGLARSLKGEDYTRGALFCHALRQELGEDGFWDVLKAWVSELGGAQASTEAAQRVAEETAGRSLADIFDPWLRTTAFPNLRLDWKSAAIAGGRWRLDWVGRQEEPVFPLRLEVEATARDGEQSQVFELRSTELVTEGSLELDFEPALVRVDPKRRSAVIRAQELTAYRRKEGMACLSRGLHERGVAALTLVAAEGPLTREETTFQAAALAALGQEEKSKALLDTVLAVSDRDGAHRALLAQVDALVEAGEPELADVLLTRLEAEVDSAVALPLRRARLIRRTGEEDAARRVLEEALEARPRSVALAEALGVEPPANEPLGTVLELPEEVVGKESAQGVPMALAEDGTALIALRSRRELLALEDGRLRKLELSEPVVGLVDVTVLETDEAPLFAMLLTGRRKSSLRLLTFAGTDGVLERGEHSRLPSRALALLIGDDTLYLGFGEESWIEWHRFDGSVSAGSEGPDDADGLKRLRLEKDERFTESGQGFPATCVALDDGRLACLQGSRLTTEGEVVLDVLDRRDFTPEEVQAIGPALAMLALGQGTDSPFAQDAQPLARLTWATREAAWSRDFLYEELGAIRGRDGRLVLRMSWTVGADGSVLLALPDERGRLKELRLLEGR
ncbi:MAG: M1 family aminopeptidase [Acidobacteriota bacterium]